MANNNYIIHPVNNETRIVVEEKPRESLPADIKKKIDDFWQSKIDSGSFLFDGKLFNVTHLSKDVIQGHFIHYRTFLAWRYTDVRDEFDLLPLSLSCITQAGSHILVGKRSPKMAQYPDLFEFAPSGGVDSECEYEGVLNIKELAQRELLEETGVTADHISGLNLFTAIHDVKEGTLELCMKIELKGDLDSLETPLDEYSEIYWLNKEQIQRSIDQKNEAWLPFSLAFWDAVIKLSTF